MFNPGDFYCGSWQTKWYWSRFLSEFFGFPLLTIIPPPHEMCDSPDQAAHYHALSPKLGASYVTQHMVGFGV
jgi:hypothetical protein